ncbi:MAG: acetyl-CoA carboxylase biotin carboxyl carrier protein subunit [Candidatus Nitrosocosmicus sp.]
MKIKVNGTEYNVEMIGNKAIVNDREIKLQIKDDKIVIENKEYHLDFYGEEEVDEKSLLIINGMAFSISKESRNDKIIKEIKAPMNGQVNEILIQSNDPIEKGQGLVVLEAMKMFNKIKSPVTGIIKEILVHKNQTVKSGDTIIILK